MIKRRNAESKRQNDLRENNKFFLDSAIKARQEKRWTSDSFFNHRYSEITKASKFSMISYLMSDKDAIKNKLNLKREKLRDLLKEESRFYEVVCLF